MACPAMTIDGVTSQVWSCLRQRAAELGVTVSGDSGTIHYLEAEVQYAWNEPAQTLTVNIRQLPPFINCAKAESYLSGAAARCGASS